MYVFIYICVYIANWVREYQQLEKVSLFKEACCLHLNEGYGVACKSYKTQIICT